MTDQTEYVRLAGPEVDAFLAEVKSMMEALDGFHESQLVTLGHGLVHQVINRKGPIATVAWLRQMADGVDAHCYPIQGAA